MRLDLTLILALAAAAWLLVFGAGSARAEEIPFTPEKWDLQAAKVVDHLGRKALMGTAFLKDAAFEDGVIEFDLAVTGARSYPGVLFRVQDAANYERFYIRPHRAGCLPTPLYPDVLQYVAAFNGIDAWQLYNGEGATAGSAIPAGQWFRVRIEVKGTQARVFVADLEQPALLINELKHAPKPGGLGLMGPSDGSAFFSSFSVRADGGLSFEPPPPRFGSPGILKDWEISRPFRALSLDLEKAPREQGLSDLGWKKVSADEAGLIDVSRYYSRSSEPDVVFVRTFIRTETERVVKLNFGYSDAASVFLNGRLVFSGDSTYQSRDPSFLGVVGFFDTAALPLRKGENEVLISLAEVTGGWGFMARDGEAIYQAPGMKKVWETSREFRVPESAAFDPDSGAVFVSNYDGYNRSSTEGKQSISRLTKDGRVETLDWVTGLKNPTGLAVHGGKLWAVETGGIVEIDIRGAKILARHAIPGAMALNDIASDASGALFVSDSRKGVIFRFAAGQAEEWLKGLDVSRPNGVWIEGGKLYWGNNGDGSLKSADSAAKEVRVIARLGQGILDGISGDGKGNLLVSHNEGRLFRVTPAGEVTLILDTTVPGDRIADFTFIPEKNLLVIPGFTGSRVSAWKLGDIPHVGSSRNLSEKKSLFGTHRLR